MGNINPYEFTVSLNLDTLTRKLTGPESPVDPDLKSILSLVVVNIYLPERLTRLLIVSVLLGTPPLRTISCSLSVGVAITPDSLANVQLSPALPSVIINLLFGDIVLSGSMVNSRVSPIAVGTLLGHVPQTGLGRVQLGTSIGSNPV